MPGKAQPLQSDQKIVNPDGTPTLAFIRWAQDRQADIVAGQSAGAVGDAISAYVGARKIIAGTGLSGGGTLDEDRTLALADTGIAAGPYTNVNITVDAQGRITSIADGAPPGIPDAPNDGNTYGRKNGAWIILAP